MHFCNSTVYRGGSSCGFCKIGGSIVGSARSPTPRFCPGWTSAVDPATPPGLSESTNSFTVAPGASVVVTLTLNGAASVVTPAR
jgi:hypothetical protein